MEKYELSTVLLALSGIRGDAVRNGQEYVLKDAFIYFNDFLFKQGFAKSMKAGGLI